MANTIKLNEHFPKIFRTLDRQLSPDLNEKAVVTEKSIFLFIFPSKLSKNCLKAYILFNGALTILLRLNPHQQNNKSKVDEEL